MLLAVPSTRESLHRLMCNSIRFTYKEYGDLKIGVLDTEDGKIETISIAELGMLMLRGLLIENLVADEGGVEFIELSESFVCNGKRRLLFDYDESFSYIQYRDYGIRIRTVHRISTFITYRNKFYLFCILRDSLGTLCGYSLDLGVGSKMSSVSKDITMEYLNVDYSTFLRVRMARED